MGPAEIPAAGIHGIASPRPAHPDRIRPAQLSSRAGEAQAACDELAAWAADGAF